MEIAYYIAAALMGYYFPGFFIYAFSFGRKATPNLVSAFAFAFIFPVALHFFLNK